MAAEGPVRAEYRTVSKRETNIKRTPPKRRVIPGRRSAETAEVAGPNLPTERPRGDGSDPPARMFIVANIGGHDAYCLIDSGSTRTLVSKSWYDKNIGSKPQTPRLKKGGPKAKSISNHSIKLHGYFEAPVKIGSFEKTLKFINVANDFGYDALLGTDCITTFDIETKMKIGYCGIQGERIPTYRRQFKHPVTGEIFPEVVGVLDQGVTIPPRIAKPVTCKVPRAYPVGHKVYAAAGAAKQPQQAVVIYPGLYEI